MSASSKAALQCAGGPPGGYPGGPPRPGGPPPGFRPGFGPPPGVSPHHAVCVSFEVLRDARCSSACPFKCMPGKHRWWMAASVDRISADAVQMPPPGFRPPPGMPPPGMQQFRPPPGELLVNDSRCAVLAVVPIKREASVAGHGSATWCNRVLSLIADCESSVKSQACRRRDRISRHHSRPLRSNEASIADWSEVEALQRQK